MLQAASSQDTSLRSSHVLHRLAKTALSGWRYRITAFQVAVEFISVHKPTAWSEQGVPIL